MAYFYDVNCHKITIPRGDDATITFNVRGVSDGNALLFRVRNVRDKTCWALTKLAIITSGVATVRLTSEDTRTFVAGGGVKYGWTLGIVTDIDEDENGNPIASDDTDRVITVFNELKEFVIADSGVLGVDE